MVTHGPALVTQHGHVPAVVTQGPAVVTEHGHGPAMVTENRHGPAMVTQGPVLVTHHGHVPATVTDHGHRNHTQTSVPEPCADTPGWDLGLLDGECSPQGPPGSCCQCLHLSPSATPVPRALQSPACVSLSPARAASPPGPGALPAPPLCLQQLPLETPPPLPLSWQLLEVQRLRSW